MTAVDVMAPSRSWQPGVRLAWALVLLLPVGLMQVGPVQVVQLAALLVVAGVLMLRPDVWLTSGAARRLLLPFGAVLAAAAISTPLSAAPDQTFRADILLVIALALAGTLAAVLTGWQDLRRFAALLVAVGSIVAIHAILTAGTQEAAFGADVVSGRATGVFSQPNELGSFLAALLVLAVGSLGWLTDRRHQVLTLAGCGVMLTALLLSLSRGAWIGAAVGVAVLFAAVPRLRRPLAWFTGAVGGVALAVFTVVDVPALDIVKARLATVTNPADNPYDNRGTIFAEAIEQFQARPLTGQGPGSFAVVATQTTAGDQAVSAEHGHHLVLTVAAEYGLLGALALLVLVTCLAVWCRQSVRDLRASALTSEAAVCATFMAALSTFLVHGMVDYPLRNPLTYFTCWILVGALVSSTLMARRQVGR